MKVRVAILENDSNYLQRVVSIFNNKFGNELEIYSFTDISSAYRCLDDKKIDVFLANENIDIDFSMIPKKCGFAYLVESSDIEKYNDKKAVCKFQRAELIYKQILSIYSEQIPNITGIGESNNSMKTIVFSSPVGGTRTSTLAAACAISIANKGFRVLYLNLENFGDSDSFFSCDGQFDFGDVIYAIKSNKSNRKIKLQSTVKQDSTGVYFYSSVRVALDMLELKVDDYLTLQTELKMLGEYDYVVIDMDFPRNRKGFAFFENCNSIVIASDGSQVSEIKTARAMDAIQILDSYSEYIIQPKFSMIRNKVLGNTENRDEIRVIGEIPMYESCSPSQMARQLSLSSVFDQLL